VLRSLHDALCVIRCLVKKRFLIAGGGAPETEISRELMLHANSLTGADAYCFKAYAEALEIIPYTLSENAGLNPIGTVTELRNRHAQVGGVAPSVHHCYNWSTFTTETYSNRRHPPPPPPRLSLFFLLRFKSPPPLPEGRGRGRLFLYQCIICIIYCTFPRISQ
jgi:hypothetical protein